MVDENITSALPDYAVEREIGKGGMGLVFLGRHVRLGRLVAIKELPPTFAADARVRERFSTEARTLATLSHPHIVPIYDYVEREGLCLIVMEELPGGTVWDRFTTTGLTPPTACAVVLACCAALQHAHDKGVLHLDVKPDNLMFARDEAIKVTDFGISRVLSGDQTLGTLDGQVLGTPAYMSPEQAKGAELTPASDVYSAGIMLYELLSGELPWTGAESATDLLLKRLREYPRELTSVAPQVPRGLAEVVMKAIEREPDKRYQRAEDFGIAIASACADAWGPNWLDYAGVAIIGSDRLSIAARTTRNQPVVDTARTSGPTSAARSTGPAPETTIGTAVGGDRAAAPETTASARLTDGTETDADTGIAVPATAAAASAAAAGAAAPVAPSEPAGPPEFKVVRAAGAAPRIEGANLNEIDRSAFVDVAEALGHPHRSGRMFALAFVLATAAVIAAALLFSAPARSGNLKRGEVFIGGKDVTSDNMTFDLTKKLPVRVRDAALAARATQVAVKFTSSPGLPLGTLNTRLQRGGAGTIDPGVTRYVATGSVKARVDVNGRSGSIAHSEFPATVESAWYLTAYGLGALIIILGGFAYFEGGLTPLRRGRLRIGSMISCGLSAAVMAVGISAFVAALGHAYPTVGGLVAAAALAAAAGVTFGLAVRIRALRRGARRAVRKAERAAVATQ
jgi:serine/threonine protein kinase